MTRQKLNLLVVEDDPRDAAMMREVLDPMGLLASAEFVSDGCEAIEIIERRGRHAGRQPDERPHVIFLDIKLGRLGGLEVVRRLRADPAMWNTIVIGFSSSSDEDDVNRCYEYGVNGYLVKPVLAAEFVRVMTSAVEYWTEINRMPT